MTCSSQYICEQICYLWYKIISIIVISSYIRFGRISLNHVKCNIYILYYNVLICTHQGRIGYCSAAPKWSDGCIFVISPMYHKSFLSGSWFVLYVCLYQVRWQKMIHTILTIYDLWVAIIVS